MDPLLIRFWYDFVDPLSFVQHTELSAVLEGFTGHSVEAIPLELAPPPDAHIDPMGEWWQKRWNQAASPAADAGLALTAPRLVPWTRKAHELVEHARGAGKGDDAVHAVFEAFFLRGRDIGRIDVLVELARDLGLDATAAKVALDVDQHTRTVLARSRMADGPEHPPGISVEGRLLEGFRNRDDLRTFLG